MQTHPGIHSLSSVTVLSSLGRGRVPFSWEMYVLLLEKQGGRCKASSSPAISHLPSAQNNQYAEVAHFEFFHLVYLLLITYLTDLNPSILSSFHCVTPLESVQTPHRQEPSQHQSFSFLYSQFPTQGGYSLQWFMDPFVPFSYFSHQCKLFF